MPLNPEMYMAVINFPVKDKRNPLTVKECDPETEAYVEDLWRQGEGIMFRFGERFVYIAQPEPPMSRFKRLRTAIADQFVFNGPYWIAGALAMALVFGCGYYVAYCVYNGTTG